MVFGLFTPDVGIRIVTISLAILALSGLSAVRLWGRDQSLRSPVDVMMAAMFFVHGTFHLFRGAYSLLLERGIEDFMAASTIHAFAFIDVIVF